ncbi:MAG TPA: 30S ribosomal protein S5 [Patescibacteria group bacterium]|nr:30S ribosomal protein S5 [Patescibacteria group bacterium]
MDNNNNRFNNQRNNNRNNNQRSMDRTPSEFEEKIVKISRVSKKTQGGNKIGFTALAVVGDRKGKVGVGLGKAPDVSNAIRKGILLAKKHMIEVPIVKGTIPFRIDVKVGAAKIMLKPAPVGSGIIAGGAIRSVVSAAGIQNISSKVLGTRNQANNVTVTLSALKMLSERYAKQRSMNTQTK